MKLYVVRSLGSKRVIGLFWCSDVAELSMLVDEEADPANAEYAVIKGAAAIRWGREGPTVGVDVPVSEDLAEERNPNSYYNRLGRSIFFTDALFDFFGGEEVPNRSWKRLTRSGGGYF